MVDDDARRDPPASVPGETPKSAVDTLSNRDDRPGRDGRRALVRDVALLALVAVSPVVQLLPPSRVAWPTFAVAVVVVAGLGVAVAVVRPFDGLDDPHRQFVLLAVTGVGVVGLAWVVLVLEPGEVRFASASLGTLVGALAARIARPVIRDSTASGA